MCDMIKLLEPIDFKKNYFDLFGLESDFPIDLATLRERYQALQGRYHPDRYATADASEQRQAMETAIFINEAFTILHHPCKRAHYLLELAGICMDDDRATLNDATFLMRQMEFHESVEKAANSPDPLVALQQLRESLVSEKKSIFDRFTSHYQGAELQQAKGVLLQLGFYNRLLDQVERHMDEYEDQVV